MGRIKIFNEDTEVLSYRVPMSKAKKFNDDNNKKLDNWKIAAKKIRDKRKLSVRNGM